MRKVSDKRCREIQNTFFLVSMPFFPENLDVYEKK
jgi:hypothetical protein